MANSQDNWNPDELPATLVDALRQADELHPGVPPGVDQAILRDAHEYLAAAPRVIRRRRVFSVVAAVSTVCAALLILFVLQPDRAPEQELAQEADTGVQVAAAEIDFKDVDRNGTVNILDAFAMARGIETGASDVRWDFNRDGELNDDDIRQVAMAAVML